MVDNLEFDYESLRYIQTRGPDDKRPKYKWGGYSQDFDAAEHVHTHEEVQAHPEDNWAVVDIEDYSSEEPRSLLIIDIDLYKADDPDEGDGVEDVEEAVRKTGKPNGTPFAKSQSGGVHVYAWVAEPVGSMSPSDFELADGVPYDIDVKGSAVSGHVVAPTDVPGVESSYELVQDGEIIGVIDPQDVLQDITYDGKQALRYRPESGGVDWDGDLPSESPEDLPACYGRALQLRRKAPDDLGNTHKVNLMAAMCGLAAGYDEEDVAGHMCGEYAPGGNSSSADEEETKYQVDHIAGMMESGRYAPPALSTLRGYGILDDGESCGDSCPIDLHSTGPDTESDGERSGGERDWGGIEARRLKYDWKVGGDAIPSRRARDVESWQWSYDDGERDEIVGLNVIEPIGSGETVTATLWLNDARYDHKWEANRTVETKVPDRVAGRIVNAEPLHKTAHRTGALYRDCLNAQARAAIAHRLTQAMNIVTVGAADDKTLYVYDPEKGIWDDDGREVIRAVFEGISPGRASDTEKREIVSKVADRTREPASEAWEPRGEFDDDGDYRVVGNGVLKLPKMQADGSVADVEVLGHSPELRARAHLPVDYNPDTDTSTVEEWLEDITAREEDARTLEEIVGNVLTTDYRHPYIVMLHGPGRNSKGTFLDVVAELAGGAESPNVAGNRLGDLAENKFRTGMLDRAIVNINGDIEGKQIQHASKLKELTGSEVQEGESKHDDAETFRNTAKLLFAANSPPLPPETKTSWAERWLPLELPYEYVSDPTGPNQKKADNTIKTRLKQEENLEAMLLLAVEGLNRLEEAQDVSLPEAPQERLEAYQKDADPIGEVDAELLTEAADPSAELPKGAVYAAYKSLARERGEEPVKAGQFWRLFKPRATVPINESRPSYEGDRVRVLKGVEFTEAAREFLAGHWLQHDWVNLDPEASEAVNDAGNAVETVSLAGIPDQSGYVNVQVDVVAKTTLNDNVVEITVQDGNAMRDIVVKDRGNDELDVADSVRTGDTVLFERVKPGADLKVRQVTEVSVIEQGPITDDDGQIGLPEDDDDDSGNDDDGDNDGAGEVVNGSNDDGNNIDTTTDGEAVTTDTPDAGEGQQDGVKADGGDSEEIDEAVMRNADAADTTAGLAGVVSREVVGADLDKVKGRIEKLRERGDIILHDTDGEDGDDAESIPEDRRDLVIEAVREVGGDSPAGNVVSLAVYNAGAGIGEDTIRNDIDALVEAGKLMETYEDTDVHSDVRYFGVN